MATRAIRFDHIAIGLPRIADALPVLVDLLGGVPDRGYFRGGLFRWATWRFANGGVIEVLEPVGDDGFLHRFLTRDGRGIHHVTFKVPSLAEVSARARARGYELVGHDESDPRWKEAFLHPRQAQGIVVQLAEARGPSPRWTPFPRPPDAPPPVRLLGLRMRAHDRSRADAQWGEVLGGRAAEAADGALVYR
ncbi:MAG: VOC family protein, partial [Candidatus Rokubacteria bacterium]|nr:VOC family protein [Candidatus Rokubacteria bacterium]